MLTEETVLEALKNCFDPEIPVNVVDLGLIYDIQIEGEQVKVKMTLTTPGCPMHTKIREDALSKIREIPEVKEAEVEIVWDPPWNRNMISAAGRKALGLE
jgi:metal-sulfur cluster biosynthetic enzyme